MSITADLGASKALLSLTLEHLPQIMLIVSRDGCIEVVNNQARVFFHTLSGKNGRDEIQVSDIFAQGTARVMKDIIVGASSGSVTLPLSNDQGTPWVKLRFKVVPLCHETRRRPDSFLLMHRETTKMHSTFAKLTGELRATNSTAARAREQSFLLKSTVDELEQFSAIAAHDLKAPLRNISMLLQFIEEDHGDALPREAREMMLLANAAADRLSRLISRLLGFARAGKGAVETQMVEVRQVIETVQENLGQVIATSQGSIAVVGDLGTIQADPVLLHQLLENLISNAIKYRDPIRAPHIRISRRTMGETGSVIELRDNGLGFDNTLAERLFEPFKRLHADSNIEGSGVGLATCRRICDRFGWRLAATGEVGVGATFRICLPD